MHEITKRVLSVELKMLLACHRSNSRSCKFYIKRLRHSSGTNFGSTAHVPSRKKLFENLNSDKEFDVLIIGGGATGSGAALDAAARSWNLQ
jgi:hypothetical protein